MARVSLTLRRQAASILRMEFREADELVKVLRESRADLQAKLEANPGNWGYRQYETVINQHIIDLETRLADAGNTDKLMEAGRKFGHDLTGEAGSVPRSSAFWEPLPALPLEALALENSRYVELIRGLTDDHKTNAFKQLKISLSQGEGITETMNRLLGTGLQGLQGRDGVFRTSRTRAEVIGRTVANDLVNRGALSSYQELAGYYPEMGLQKMWMTTSDNRTSERCTSLIGQIRDLSEDFEAFDGWRGQNPPSHPQCRSRVVSLSKKYKAEWEAQWALPDNRLA